MKPAAGRAFTLAAGVVAGLVAAGGVFGLGYLWRGKLEASSQRSAPDTTAAVLAELERKLAHVESEALRTRVYASHARPLEPQGAEHPGEAVPPPAEEPARSQQPRPSDAELLEQEQEQVHARFARYEDALNNERRDNPWATEMEQRLRSLQAELRKTHLPGTRLQRVECRATLCTVELEHASTKERSLLPMLLRVEGLPRVSLLKQDDTDGRGPRSVAYLAAERLPTEEGSER